MGKTTKQNETHHSEQYTGLEGVRECTQCGWVSGAAEEKKAQVAMGEVVGQTAQGPTRQI
jgi:hypothetical protein